jgi:hypothetical protein
MVLGIMGWDTTYMVMDMIGLWAFFQYAIYADLGKLIMLNYASWPNWDSVCAILRLAMAWSIF